MYVLTLQSVIDINKKFDTSALKVGTQQLNFKFNSGID